MGTSLQIDEASEPAARALLHQCCGSRAWVEAMLARRPFGSTAGLLRAAHESWWSLGPHEWKEAFASHPKIGDRSSTGLPAREQAGVRRASEDMRSALADGNHAYLEKFGYIFIVCATGRSAAEMLAILRERLGHDPDREIRIAAGEQEKITAIRLEALQAPGSSSAHGGSGPNP
jgi:OHCU decarboxylase